MCDDRDDNAGVEASGSYENRQIYSQNFGNSNFRAARGNGRNNDDRNPRFNRNSGENTSNGRFGGGQYRNNRSTGYKSWGNNSYPEDNQSEVLNVPSHYIGRIIGRGGSKINELQAESGAKIQVTKEIIGDDTVVKIFGSQDSIDQAKSLINSITTETFKYGKPGDN